MSTFTELLSITGAKDFDASSPAEMLLAQFAWDLDRATRASDRAQARLLDAITAEGIGGVSSSTYEEALKASAELYFFARIKLILVGDQYTAESAVDRMRDLILTDLLTSEGGMSSSPVHNAVTLYRAQALRSNARNYLRSI